MTELEIMQRAKLYMDKLANGFDPITNTELPEDAVLNNVRLSRCFFYVSGILRQVIENGGRVGTVKRNKRVDFYLPPEVRENFPVSERPIRITGLVDQINAYIDEETMRKLSTTVVTNWLLDGGLLEVVVDADGKKRRYPTQDGEYIGLSTETRMSQYGEYRAVLYNANAQRFVLDNLDAILGARKKARRPAANSAETPGV